MAVRIGINGFGRIGRCILAHYIESGRDDIEIVKINATGPITTSAHLLRYDSVHGRLNTKITTEDNRMNAGRGFIDMISTYNPDELDWDGVDVVMECSGKFNSYDGAKVHLQNGAKRVLISAPAKNPDRTVIFGVNHKELTRNDHIVSNGSCTTNCLVPLAKILHDEIGIESAIMTTIHSYTGDQSTIDRRHKDLYRARAGAVSMIPTTTGAAKAIGEVLPELAGKFDGSAVRVPTPNVSAIDLTFQAKCETSIDEINTHIENAAVGKMKNIIVYDSEPKVSIDFNHTEASSIFAPAQTRIVGKRFARIFAWYDNEWAFSCRMCDVAAHIGELI